MKKVSKKLQDKLDVLKDNKYAIKIWKMYKKYYKKNYTSPEEEKERLAKFLDNLKLIIQENFRFDEGQKSFRLQLNQFGDMSLEEFRQKLTGLNADGQGEKEHGDDQDDQQRFRRSEDHPSLFDVIKKKVKQKIKDEIKKSLLPGSSSSGKKTIYYYSTSYYKPSLRPVSTAKTPSSGSTLKATVDYRPYMNPVENQGRCGLVVELFLFDKSRN